MVEALGIIIGRRPKGSTRKVESQTIVKIGCVPIFTNFGRIKAVLYVLEYLRLWG